MKIKIICEIPKETVIETQYWGLSDEDWNTYTEREKYSLVEGWVRNQIVVRFEYVEHND